MPTTPTFGFHYASLTDAPNGPAQLQQLATDLDTYLASLPLVQRGTATVHVTAANTYTTLAVLFPTAFSAAPSVVVSVLVAGTGAITEFGYDSPAGSGFNIGVARTVAQDTVLSWIAVGPR